MTHTNPIIKRRFQVVYQAWSEDDRPALRLTPLGSIVADEVFGSMVKNRLVKPCNCGKKEKKGE